MATRQQFIKRCKEVGVKPVIDDRYYYGIECPKGYVLGIGDMHEVSIWWNDSWRVADIYNYLIEDLSMGIDKCQLMESIGECDWCESQDWTGEV